MCNFWSAIITKNGDVLYDNMTDSHEDIVQKYKLDDSIIEVDKRDFVRIEILPPDGDVFNKELATWEFKIDELEAPKWLKNRHEKSARKMFEKVYHERIFDSVKNAVIKLSRAIIRNSSVEARGNSSVEAWENSSVEARGNSSVEARGNSSVVARENSVIRNFKDYSGDLFSPRKVKKVKEGFKI